MHSIADAEIIVKEETTIKVNFYLENTVLDLLKENSIDDIRVIDIIHETGICKSTFYKYYQDKYDLLVNMFERMFYREIKSGSKDTESFLKSCLRVFRREPIVVANAFSSQDMNSIRTYQEGLMRNFAHEDMRKVGLKPSDEQQSFACDLFVHNSSDIIMNWLRSDCEGTEEDVCRTIKNVVPYIICDLTRMKLRN